MYVPPAFKEPRREVLHGLILAHPFGVLVSHDPAAEIPLVATHLPFLLESDHGPNGTLLTHLAKPNEQWKTLAGCADAGREVLAIFQGPHAYISPGWYAPAVPGRSVPTWNYAVVHAYGRPRMIGDDHALRDLLRRTVRRFEGEAGNGENGRMPWRMEDLAEDFLAAMVKGVVGFEIEISRLEGKFKLGQNRSAEDRDRVSAELERSTDSSIRGMAALMSPGNSDRGPKDPA